MGHGGNARSGRLGEFADPIQNRNKAGQNFLLVLFRDGESGESGELVEVLGVEVHGVKRENDVCFIILFF